MKKLKSKFMWVCALCFLLSSLSLAACKNNDAAYESGLESSVSDSTEHSSDSETDFPVSSQPPETNSSNDEIEDIESSLPPILSTPPTSSSSSTPPIAEEQDETVQYLRCTSDNVNIRSGAGTDYAVLGTAKKGTMYAIIGKVGGWYKTYYRGKVAYISASFFSVVQMEKSTNQKVENVLLEGYKLIGTPYVYGAVRLHDGTGKLLSGFSSQKFDCSSLVQYVFYKGANAILQVHTRTQVKQGSFVKKSDLQRGDCIFFTNEQRQYNTGIERIGHVAIYLGDDYILHTASDYACIEKMTAKRWSFYVEARRFT